MKQSIKYQYALDEENQIIDISMINKEHRSHSNYYCLACGRELIAKLGEKKQKHFAHKFNTAEFSCNNETYLHRLAKIKIKEKFDKSESFFIKLRGKVICSSIEKCEFAINKHLCIQEKDKLIDLKKYYNLCSIEKSIKGLRADLLLESTTTGIMPILIEIFVTHSCSQDKINSKLPIIEIPIQSEEDIKTMENEIEFCGQTYNLHIKDIHEPMEINYTIQKYVLFSSGKYLYKSAYQTTCRHIKTPQYNHAILEISVYEQKFCKTDFLFYAITLGYNLKDCFICRYFKYIKSMYGNYPLCMKYKEFNTPKSPNYLYAYFCSQYAINKSLYEQYSRNTSQYQIKIIKNNIDSFNNINFKSLWAKKISYKLKACISLLEQCYHNKGLRLKVGNMIYNLSSYYNSCESFKNNDFTYGLKFYHSTRLNRTHLFLYCVKDGYSNTEKKDKTKAIYLKIDNKQDLKEFSSYTGITIHPCKQSIFHNIEEKKPEGSSKKQTNQEKKEKKTQYLEVPPRKGNTCLDNLSINKSEIPIINKDDILDYIEKEFKTKNIFIERIRESPVSLKFLYNECKRCNIKGYESIKVFNTLNSIIPIFIQPCSNIESPLKSIPTVVLRIDSQGIWKEWSHKNCLLIKEGKNGEFYNIINLNETVPDETLNLF